MGSIKEVNIKIEHITFLMKLSVLKALIQIF